ncbi:ABC transporter permease subunit [Rhodovastum atsumiense]|uniref:ABC transporter permease subunit n=1 Tax=Rhodovastum atsumiense TaxID=504468 RepID=A0A5M6IR93_9PROT|nr:ABC transporter permease subunit [Rhodovastum atsumiense]KAA5610806.1 ABC transporter permease subunit [Rhodovastum atsumiense]CAH2602149.1 ABC transporter permease subunit [Rhodovastum atsumiense]
MSTPRFPRSTGFWLQLVLTLLVSAFLIAPMLVSVLAGLTRNAFQGLGSGLTLRWVAQVLDSYLPAILLSVQLALLCLAVTLLVGVPAAYALARLKGRAARLIEEALVLPVAVPGLATGLALVIAYNGWGGFRQSIWFILAGHVLFTLPFMLRPVLAVMAASDLRTLEEGAASLGAGFFRRFFDVVLPNCRPGILAGSLAVVTLSMGEFNLTWLLHTPTTQTLPVGLADAYASLRLEVGSAYTLVFFVLIVPLLVALQRPGLRS